MTGIGIDCHSTNSERSACSLKDAAEDFYSEKGREIFLFFALAGSIKTLLKKFSR
jgi:hypothetical protein